MVVAFHFPHNEGVVYGIFDRAGETTNLSLVDLYEVDGQIQTFETVAEAQHWLAKDHGKGLVDTGVLEPNKIYDIAYER
jgi:hypothetical protein